jgi:outer membrane protein OmpA-like peptidoglycan-associated protein
MEQTTWIKLVNHDWKPVLAGSVLALALGGCASKPSPELVDARRAYDRAEDSPAPKRDPRDLERAKLALDRAEEAHEADPGSAREQHLAQTAKRRADEARLRSEDRQARLEDTTATASAERARQRHADDVAAARVERERVEQTHAVDDKPVTKAEARKASAALQNLGPIANVKEEPRGVVITLSGTLLFPNGEKEMSPIAKQNLDQVAHALAEQPASTTFEVAGHTDDSGSDKQNKQLADQRAKAVADYLIGSGIDAARIRTAGYGEDRPIASNDTPEGRAENRRVEILVTRHDQG